MMAQQLAETPGKLLGEGRTAEIYAWGDGQALKLYRTGWPVSWVEHEARVSSAVAATGLPVPAVGGTLELDGRYGILFERISGPSLLQQFSVRPWTVAHSLRVFTDLHLAMSRQRVSRLPSQREELARRIHEAPTVPEAIRAQALERLNQLPDGDALCHGDYHPDNVLMTQTGPIIIDWGSASNGHPLADVAQTELLLQMGEPPPSQKNRWLLTSARALVRRAYVGRYLRRSPAHAAELAVWRFPIAVARLSEGIVEERDKLLRLIGRVRV
jgi:aminoglycoside phosphotransferase (APT) family kinase protein